MKTLFICLIVLIGLFAFGQGLVLEHRNIPIAPEIVEIVDSFLLIGAGRFIEVYNIESDTINKVHTNVFNGYVYDIQYDTTYIYVSPLRFFGDSIHLFFRDSLPMLVEHSSLYGSGAFSVNDSLLITGIKQDTLLIYKRDSISADFSLVNKHFGSYSIVPYPTMIFDTFYFPSYSIADILNPYELSSTLPYPYIIENDTILYGYSDIGSFIAAYNISDISNPVLLDTIFNFTDDISYNQSEKQRMKKFGDYLYINFKDYYGGYYGDFIIYNVSDLHNISEVNRFDFSMNGRNRNFTNDLDVYNNQLFFSKSEHGLQVYDINDTVNPIFNYSMGISPVFFYTGLVGPPLFQPTYIDNQFYMPDYNGIYFANKNGWNYDNYKKPFDGITGFCGIDSVILIADSRNTGITTLSILNENLSVIDSIDFVSDKFSYDIIIPYNDYILLKHNDFSTYLKTYWKLFKRDINNHLTYIDSLNLYSSDIADCEIMGNNLIILDGHLKLFDISDIENTSLICSLPINNYIFDINNVLAHKRDYLFYLYFNDIMWNTELYCFHLKPDTLEEIWDTTFSLPCMGIEFVNNYLVFFPHFDYNLSLALIYDVADPENPGSCYVSPLFKVGLAQSVVESNYVYFAGWGTLLNRVKMGDKEAECTMLDSLYLGDITLGDSLITSVEIANTSDKPLYIDSIISGSCIDVPNPSFYTVVSPRHYSDIDFVLKPKITGLCTDSIMIFTNDVYDISNKCMVYANGLTGILEKSLSLFNDKIQINNNMLYYSISKDSDINIKITDILGRIVFDKNQYQKRGKYSINIDNDFPSGVYFLIFNSKSLNNQMKFFIIK